MIYCILYNPKKVQLFEAQKSLQNEIIQFIADKIKPLYKYRIIFYENTHINDFDFNAGSSDIYLWSPDVVYNNLDLVKQYKNSIVILSKPTILIQKLSKLNPVNENMAFNNGFFVYYINKERNDITNHQWKLLIEKREYLLNDDDLKNFIDANTPKVENLVSNAKMAFKEFKIKNNL